VIDPKHPFHKVEATAKWRDEVRVEALVSQQRLVIGIFLRAPGDRNGWRSVPDGFSG